MKQAALYFSEASSSRLESNQPIISSQPVPRTVYASNGSNGLSSSGKISNGYLGSSQKKIEVALSPRSSQDISGPRAVSKKISTTINPGFKPYTFASQEVSSITPVKRKEETAEQFTFGVPSGNQQPSVRITGPVASSLLSQQPNIFRSEMPGQAERNNLEALNTDEVNPLGVGVKIFSAKNPGSSSAFKQKLELESDRDPFSVDVDAYPVFQSIGLEKEKEKEKERERETRLYESAKQSHYAFQLESQRVDTESFRNNINIDFLPDDEEEGKSSATQIAAAYSNEFVNENRQLSRRVGELELELKKWRIELVNAEAEHQSLQVDADKVPRLRIQIEEMNSALQKTVSKSKDSDSKFYAFQESLADSEAQINKLKALIEEEQNKGDELAAEISQRQPFANQNLSLELKTRGERIQELENEKSALFVENYELKQKLKSSLDHSFTKTTPTFNEAQQAKIKQKALLEDNEMLRAELDLLRAAETRPEDWERQLVLQRDIIFTLRKDNEHIAKELLKLKKEKEYLRPDKKTLLPRSINKSLGPTFNSVEIPEPSTPKKPSLVPPLDPQRSQAIAPTFTIPRSKEEEIVAKIRSGNEALRREGATDSACVRVPVSCMPTNPVRGISQKIKNLFA